MASERTLTFTMSENTDVSFLCWYVENKLTRPIQIADRKNSKRKTKSNRSLNLQFQSLSQSCLMRRDIQSTGHIQKKCDKCCHLHTPVSSKQGVYLKGARTYRGMTTNSLSCALNDSSRPVHDCESQQ